MENGFRKRQFTDAQRAAAIDLLESPPWGDMEWKIYGLEAALALALEAVGGDRVQRWEDEGNERFGDDFKLSAEQVASLDDEWRLVYIARLLDCAAIEYGVSSYASPGRNSDGEITSPASWNEDPHSVARLLRGLNDILYGLPPETGAISS
jgi:hypothetical protein